MSVQERRRKKLARAEEMQETWGRRVVLSVTKWRYWTRRAAALRRMIEHQQPSRSGRAIRFNVSR